MDFQWPTFTEIPAAPAGFAPTRWGNTDASNSAGTRTPGIGSGSESVVSPERAAATTTGTTRQDSSSVASSPEFRFESVSEPDEPEPARIASDVLPAPSFSTTNPVPPPPALPPLPLTRPGPPPNFHGRNKYATPEERKKAIGEALKKRWASGSMNHVHKKRLETVKKRRLEAEAAEALHKKSGLSSKPPSNTFLNLGSLSVTPADRLARLLEEHQSPLSSSSLSDVEDPHDEDASLEASDSHFEFLPVIDDDDDDDWEQESEPDGESVQEDGDTAMGIDPVPPPPAIVSESTLDDDRQTMSIEQAASGRPYNTWNGAHTYGTLIPDGYEKQTATPGYPWICPVRSCRKLFAKPISLGGHFVRQHRGCLLHDNQDGTFSDRGTYASLRDTTKGENKKVKPALVISRGPPDPSEPPMVEPSMPVTFKAVEIQDSMLENDDSVDFDLPEAVQDSLLEESPPDSGSQPSKHNVKILELDLSDRAYNQWLNGRGQPYTLAFNLLLPTGYELDSTIPGRPWICPVRTCRQASPREQDLGCHFQRAHYGTYLNDNGDQTFSIVRSYRSKKGAIGNGGKIIYKAPPYVISQFPIEEGSTATLAPVELPNYLVGRTKYRAMPEESPDIDLKDEQPEMMAVDALGFDGVRRRRHDAALVSERRRVGRPSERLQQQAQAQISLPTSRETSMRQDLTPMAADNFVMEMEDWELAPGNLREQKSADIENIAFSKPYLSTGHSVPVYDEISFRVDTVYSGKSLELTAETGKTRLCSLASGKLRVKLGDEPAFVIGPHGMFKVKAGVTVSIRNLLYIDAVLHTTILDF